MDGNGFGSGAAGNRSRVISRRMGVDQLAAMRAFWRVYERIHDDVQREILAFAHEHEEFGPIVRSMSAELMDEQNRRSHDLGREAVMEGRWEPFIDDLTIHGTQYADMDISFTGWFEVVGAMRSFTTPRLLEAADLEGVPSERLIVGLDTWLDVAMAVIGEAYLSTKQETIRSQQETLQELSTPVLLVRDRLLLLPLIGIIDTYRARQVTEQLLGRIRDVRARVVVMDITGVAAVDSQVASHLLQTVEAARLMGADVIVTGLSPSVAQSLVALGVDLAGLRTLVDLQSGIEEAERLMHRPGSVARTKVDPAPNWAEPARHARPGAAANGLAGSMLGGGR